jgi:class 3 adenylate cyclase/HAMP domain-containing protein
MIKAFDGKAEADQEYESDQWSTSLSAYIPIKDNTNRVIAILGVDMDVSNQRNKLNQLLLLFVFIVAISFLLTLAVSFLVAKFLTRNLEKLRLGVEKVRNRDFSTQIEVSSKDEFGMVADTFNSMVREVKDYAETLEKQKEAFHRFVPTQFLEFLNKKSAVDISLGDSSPYRMSVLFSDIRSFTTLSEKIGHRDMFQFLNLYLNKMEPAIKQNMGFVDKYIGDSIMALFPDGKPTKEANGNSSTKLSGDSAIKAAIEMRKNLHTFNQEHELEGENPIEIGIGIATGDLILGIVGSETRLESTVIGETVNIASRMESLTSFYKVSIILTESTRLSTNNPNIYLHREIDTVIPKGAIKPMILYEVFEGESEREKSLKTKTSTFLQEGIHFYKKGEFTKAYKAFQQGRIYDPEDYIFELYTDRCSQYIKNPPIGEWTGIWKFNQK